MAASPAHRLTAIDGPLDLLSQLSVRLPVATRSAAEPWRSLTAGGHRSPLVAAHPAKAVAMSSPRSSAATSSRAASSKSELVEAVTVGP
uniref:Uncharacterized protein n=1 Tax=Mycobacterium sp. (strain MCS) TaxID=164756 RepID=A0A5Q5BML8_MYCSS